MLDQPITTGPGGGAQTLENLSPIQSDSLLALIAMADGRSEVRQDRRRRRRLPRRRRPHADPARGQGGRAEAVGAAGKQGLSRKLRRPALHRIAAPDPARPACRRRPDHGHPDAGRLRRAGAGVQADRVGQSRRAGAGWNSDLAEPCAGDLRRQSRDRSLRLLRPRQSPDPLRRDDDDAGRCTARRRRPAPRLLPQSDRRGPRRGPMGRRGAHHCASRAAAVHRHCLSGPWAAGSTRMRRGCTRCSMPATRSSSPRAATRISACIATASARCTSRPRSRPTTSLAMDHVAQIAREMWSMPPDHGAAAVRIVLEDETLKADWLAELGEMRGAHQPNSWRDRRGRPAPGLYRRAVRHVLDAAVRRDAGACSFARPMRSTWPTAGASTSSAWPIMPSPRFIAAIVEAMNG